jgi:hypothetical protein
VSKIALVSDYIPNFHVLQRGKLKSCLRRFGAMTSCWNGFLVLSFWTHVYRNITALSNEVGSGFRKVGELDE